MTVGLHWVYFWSCGIFMLIDVNVLLPEVFSKEISFIVTGAPLNPSHVGNPFTIENHFYEKILY